jgi:ketosteroid isomerase-like protein
MNDREEFLVWLQSDLVRAERAMFDGDDAPRRAIWSSDEPVSVLGEMAYTVGYERASASIDGAPRTFTLRATQVYRREHDGWRVVHRHADAVG